MSRNPCWLQQLGAFPLHVLLPKPSCQAYSYHFLGILIIVIYVYEERHAPISGLRDTATELVSLSTNCLSRSCPLHIASLRAGFSVHLQFGGFLSLISRSFCWGSPLFSVLKWTYSGRWSHSRGMERVAAVVMLRAALCWEWHVSV